MTIDHKAVGRKFFEESIRTEAIIHLGTMCQDYAFPDIAEDAFRDDWEDICSELDIDPEKCVPDDREEITALLYEKNKQGFLIQFATPVPSFNSPTSWSSHGWGFYNLKWIYAETLEEAFKKAISWRDEYIDKQRQKQGFERPDSLQA